MNQTVKNTILQKAKTHVSFIRSKLAERKKKLTEKTTQKEYLRIQTLPYDEMLAMNKVFQQNQEHKEELEILLSSPYFVRCEVSFDDSKNKEILYFGKLSFSHEGIYSWVTPAATIRFEQPGQVSYTKPDGTKRKGILLRKDTYMIVDGNILFLATESVDYQRELVHQEHFSNQKSDFVLPEIVAQMEKAQDQVIRADHEGSFVISGPAGSGKTTLALHRIAYLVQSPDTTKFLPRDSIIVFVQDSGTKEYFSHLLPELGINEVKITTFSEWGFEILGLNEVTYASHITDNITTQDMYEHAKLNALSQMDSKLTLTSDCFTVLNEAYKKFLSATQKKILQKQKSERVLDRIDLTVLLKSFENTNGELTRIRTDYIDLGKGKFRKDYVTEPIRHSLVILDEFQNYTPAQISLIKNTLDQKTQSMVYVGDMAQQVRLGTIKGWGQVNEHISDGRNVKLQKVYRNTKHILEYIRRLGYSIEIPKAAKEGIPVQEILCKTPSEEIKYIKKLTEKDRQSSIGVLAKDKKYLDNFKNEFKDQKSVHLLSMDEAQGVEFETVVLVGINEDTIRVQYVDPEELVKEKFVINKDRLYVALTRAISELHVLGTEKLSVVCKKYYT